MSLLCNLVHNSVLPYGCCAGDCSVACCTAQHTAIATLTVVVVVVVVVTVAVVELMLLVLARTLTAAQCCC